MALKLDKDKFKQLQAAEQKPKTHTIFIVDDEEANLRGLRIILEKDYNILDAKDGQEALDLVKNDENPERIHLIISDQRMPRLTGVEFLKRTIPLIPKTVRIILTGFTDVEDIIGSINEGQIYKFITKPVEPKDLLITVKRALELYDLEAQNVVLAASNRRLAEIHQTKEELLRKLNEIYERDLHDLEKALNHGIEVSQDAKELCRQSARSVHHIKELLQPITQLYFTEKAIQSKRVLLAESNKKQQMIAKMALGGTGVQLDIVADLTNGAELLAERHYDILCVDSQLIPLVIRAYERNPKLYSVFMTSEDVPTYLPILEQYPMLSNIVSRNDEDRTFTLKNILTTVSKLLNQDLFGLEKYLNWGVEVRQQPITQSDQRLALVQQMEAHMEQLGVRRSILSKCALVVEELLMNAIYDAPSDAAGKPLYNHLPRTQPLALRPEEQGTFRYACDGLLLAVSVADPFGGFTRKIILDYLKSCYGGQAGTLQENKGGAGRGLFQIMETSDLVVWNVKPNLKTEVIALFNLDPQTIKTGKTTSFHYFSG